MTALARSIDHVVVEHADNRALFEFLTGRLGLPVAWAFGDWGIVEGGVALGNCNIGCNPPFQASDGAFAPRIGSVMLEPDGSVAEVLVRAAADGLDVMHVLDHPAVPDHLGDDEVGDVLAQGWSIAGVGLATRPQPFVLFCGYVADLGGARATLARRMASAGGPLGVVDLAEVRFPVPDVEADRALWRALAAAEREPGSFAFDSGPDLRLIEGGPDDGVLALRVRSLDDAAANLRSLGIPSVRHGSEIVPDRAHIAGAPIVLIA